jgi:hypothetical protein
MPEKVSLADRVVEAVTIEIAKLEVKPGDIVAMICPDHWEATHIQRASEYFKAYIEREKLGIKLWLLPHGTELSIIKKVEGE